MPALKLKKVTAEYLAEKAREAEKEKEKSKKALDDTADGEQADKNGEADASDEKPQHFLEVEILSEKRKRTLPLPELKLIEWLDSNFEKKTDVYLPILTLYEFYSEVCQMQGVRVVDVPIFNKFVKSKFGKFFGYQENSPYRVLLKERKKKEKKAQVQGETLQIKLRDIITEVINEAGNPRKGLRFNVISKAIVQKYPAQRVDLHQKKLKHALEKGASYGHFEQVRGVGMCGYYRVTGEPMKLEKVEKDEKPKEEGNEDTTTNGEATEGGDGGDKCVSEKNVEAETKDGNSTTEEKKDKDGEQPAKKKCKRKINKKKKKVEDRWIRSEVERHSDPTHVEDAFPLAITYQSDPKTASVTRIKSYITKHYHIDLTQEQLKRSLESGVGKGMWELSSGNNMNGSYHLLIDTFQPGRSSSQKDRIAQALVACNEPKMASAKMIKSYITQYHPKFGIDVKPHVFKKALERACNRGIIKQLSGIGSMGTFQLVDPFFPSPAVLAGDMSDDEESDVVSDDDDDEGYVPRPTKHKRSAQTPKPKKVAETSSKLKLKKSQSKSTEKASGRRSVDRGAKAKAKRYTESSDEESEEEDEKSSKPSKQRGRKVILKSFPSSNKSETLKSGMKNKTSSKKNLSAKSWSKSNSDSDDEEKEVVRDTSEYTPRPSKSRGGGDRTDSNADKAPAHFQAKKKAAKRKPIEKTKVVESGDGSVDGLTANISPHKQPDSESPVHSESKSSSKKGAKKHKLMEEPKTAEPPKDSSDDELEETHVISTPKKRKHESSPTSKPMPSPQPKKGTAKHALDEETSDEDSKDKNVKVKEAKITKKGKIETIPVTKGLAKSKIVEESINVSDNEITDVTTSPKKSVEETVPSLESKHEPLKSKAKRGRARK